MFMPLSIFASSTPTWQWRSCGAPRKTQRFFEKKSVVVEEVGHPVRTKKKKKKKKLSRFQQ